MDNEEDYNPEEMIRELRATFREEAYELLAELESALLQLEKTPHDKEQIGRVFRAMHTIKGSGGACAFTDITAFTHELESIFDRVRNGNVAVTQALISLTLTASDQMRAIFDRAYRGGAADDARSSEILAAFKTLLSEKPAPGQPASPGAKRRSRTMTYRIRFHLQPRGALNKIDPEALLSELRMLGPCQIVPQHEPAAHRTKGKPRQPASWDVILSTNQGIHSIRDIFTPIKDRGAVKIEIVDGEDWFEDDARYKKLGQILLERGDVTTEELQTALVQQKRVGEMLIETGIVLPSKVESALAEQQQVRELREQRTGAGAAASIRVGTEKLDSLVDLVGELVTVQARLSQTAKGREDDLVLQMIAEELERLSGALRDSAMSIRMLPIGTTFGKFKRLVRDLSAELDKDIELETSGAETELDKTVIERLSDPLVHMIRNCIDHGIESPAQRKTAGKPGQGTIRLSAMHSGAHVLIRVEDDGAGLDADAIRATAMERGLLRAGEELPEEGLWQLILVPGFSTSKTITDVSGRGVGMDVVKSAIDSLRGTMEISSRKGQGTMITLSLPLTLAIIDGFLTRTGDAHLIFPLSLVEECVELETDDALNKHGRCLANVRGQLVPYIRLREILALGGGRPTYEHIVIVSVNSKRIGFVVDTVIGEHQTVIKPLGRVYAEVEGISGGTILGDGSVALILDVPGLVRLVEREESVSAEQRMGKQ